MATGIVALLVRVAFSIVIIALVARFLARLGKADSFNPLAQTIAAITNPILRPVQMLVRSYRGFDLPALLMIWLAQLLLAVIMISLSGNAGVLASNLVTLISWSLLGMAAIIMEVLRWSMLIVAIGSFLTMGSYNPFLAFIARMIEPFVGPFRRLNLQVGILDLSFLLAFLALTILKNFVLLGLAQQLGYRGGLFIGL